MQFNTVFFPHKGSESRDESSALIKKKKEVIITVLVQVMPTVCVTALLWVMTEPKTLCKKASQYCFSQMITVNHRSRGA